MEVPISPDALTAVAAVSRELQQQPAIPLARLRSLMESNCAEVKCIVCTFLFDYPQRVEGMVDHWRTVCALFLPSLVESVQEDLSNDYRLSRYEAAGYVQQLFIRLWEHQASAIKELIEIRSRIAELCRSSDPAIVDAIVLGFLEHVFCDDAIVGFFSSWRDEPLLAGTFAEARRLAVGFQRLNEVRDQ